MLVHLKYSIYVKYKEKPLKEQMDLFNLQMKKHPLGVYGLMIFMSARKFLKEKSSGILFQIW